MRTLFVRKSEVREGISGSVEIVHSPPQYVREDERGHDRRVRLDDVLRRVDAELAPGDLLVRHRAGVRAVARSRIADLAEVAPQRHVRTLQILMQHRDDADGEVAGDAASDL